MDVPALIRLSTSLAGAAIAGLVVTMPAPVQPQTPAARTTLLSAPTPSAIPSHREVHARASRCPSAHAFAPPFDGKLTLRSAYRTAKPHVYQFCPKWSGFGTARGRHHGGIDLAAPTGTAVRAAVDGMLTYAHDPGGYGRFAKIRFRAPKKAHDGTCSASEEIDLVYAHLMEEPKTSVARLVRAGDVIGHVGCTGNARGMCSPSPESHLHVTVERVLPRARLDPETFLGWNVSEVSEAEKPAELVACGK